MGSFFLSNSKRNMNNFIHSINGFYTNNVYYTDTDILYIENKHWDNLDKAGIVGTGLLQGKNDFKDGVIFYGVFLAPKNTILFNYKGIRCYRRTQDFQRIHKCV